VFPLSAVCALSLVEFAVLMYYSFNVFTHLMFLFIIFTVCFQKSSPLKLLKIFSFPLSLFA